MKQVSGEQELLERLAALPREVAPERDVWPAIAQRIGQGETPNRRQSSSRWWIHAVAASLAVVFITGVLIGRQWDTAPRMAQPGVNQAQAVWVGGLTGTLTASELEYQAAFREFISVGEFRGILPLQAVENLTAGWAELSAAETALTNALRNNPGNSFLSAKMLELRSRQLDFLKQIASLDQNSRRITI
jgi:hypothetical protein